MNTQCKLTQPQEGTNIIVTSQCNLPERTDFREWAHTQTHTYTRIFLFSSLPERTDLREWAATIPVHSMRQTDRARCPLPKSPNT